MVISIEKKEQNKTLFLDKNTWFIVVTSVLLFCNFLLPNDYLSMLCTLLACVYIFTCKRKYLIPSMVYFSMFAYVFIIGHYQVFIFVCIAFLARAMILNEFRFLVGIFLIPLYFMVHLVSTDISVLSIGDYISFFIVVSLFFMCHIYKKQDRKLVIQYFLLGHIITTLLGLFKGYTRYIEFVPLDYEGWGVGQYLRFSGLTYDPNFYTINAVIALCVLLFGYQFELKNSIGWIICVLITVIFGLLTYSKSCFLCFIIIGIFAIIKTPKKIRNKIFLFLPFLIALMIIFRNDINGVVNTIMERFNSEDGVDGITTGRSTLWWQYIELIFSSAKSFLIGNGLIPEAGQKAAHNTYLEIFYKFGIIGFLFEIIYFWASYKQIKGKSFKNNVSNWLLIVLIVLLFFNLSAYSAYNFILSIFMVFILVKNEDKGEKNGINKYYYSRI